MKNVTCLGFCWVMTLGLVTAAFGQQNYDLTTSPPPAVGQSSSRSTPQWQDPQVGQASAAQSAASQRIGPEQQRGFPAPSASQNQSAISGPYQSQGAEMSGGQRRGELGVWLVESGGPGVTIQRITQGSAAEQAGLRSGDVILQVNGRGAASPHGTAQMIRQMPIGQSGTLTIWRDGDQQQLQVMMQPAREIIREMGSDMRHQVGFSGSESSTSDLISRTQRLEQQIGSLTQELQAMRQELAQLRSQHSGAQPARFEETNQATPFQGTSQQPSTPPGATPPTATNQTPPPPGFGQTVEKPATASAEPSTPPAAEKPTATDPFGTGPTPANAEGKPKSDTEPKKESVDSLF